MRRAALVILLSAGLVALPAVALADPRPVPPRPGGGNGPQAQTTPAPPAGGGGQAFVDGAGSVRVSGNFLAFGDVRGMTVRVTDRYGDARVRIGGKVVMKPIRGAKGSTRRTITLRAGTQQRVSVEGCRADVVFRGAGNVALSITGAGLVRLDGVGKFHVNNGAERSWPLRPLTIPLRPTPPGGRG